MSASTPVSASAESASAPGAVLLRTPLHDLHGQWGARRVAFAGYDMPVSFPAGIVAEHRHARAAAALFDVSHMGQIRLTGPRVDLALERLVPMDIVDLPVGRQRYAFFTDDNGGLLDDLMVLRRADDLLLVVNASRKSADLQWLQQGIGNDGRVEALADRALLALQGPQAVQALARLNDRVGGLKFMDGCDLTLGPWPATVTRSGYTGEDGFEISVAADDAAPLARALLAMPEVRPAGLGARDTLRLEAGLCLHGHDIDTSTTPVEAALAWALPRVRRPSGARAAGYPGAAVIEQQLLQGPARRRVGLLGAERVPVREGAVLHDAHGEVIGAVTSGTLAPTADRVVAMGYVLTRCSERGSTVFAAVRNRLLPLEVVALPFVAHRYHRG